MSDHFDHIDPTVSVVRLDPYSRSSPTFVTVVDADALLSSIDNHCRTGRTPRLLGVAASRASHVYAADHVYAETYRGFDKIATSSPASADELRACFEERYLPHLRWVATDIGGIVDERVSLVTDATDVPTAHLASLIAPCLVLSGDGALRRPGFAPDDWRRAAADAIEVVDASIAQETAALVLGLPAIAVVGGGVKLARVTQAPWWASLGALCVGAYVLLSRPGWRGAIKGATGAFVTPMLDLFATAAEREHDGARRLKPTMFEPSYPASLEQQIATVLARSAEPLLATEIYERVARHFGTVPSEADVRSTLDARPEFHRPSRYRWQLGRILGRRPQ